ncbi:MAG: hypothetical protein KAT00_05755 [Planctomycetes bacterium]|nr:hypothetical protein [Planctomycetota bacterium]
MAEGEGVQTGNSDVVWTEGLSEEQMGVVQNKGWGGIGAMLDSYTHAEKMIGADPSTILRMPTEQTAESMGEIYNRLGRPETADGYDFGLPESEKAVADFLRGSAHKHGFSKSQAEGFAKELLEFTTTANTDANDAAKIQADQDAVDLKKSWGAKHDENLSVAKAAANEFGLDKGTINKLESVLGFKETMELFQNIGSKIGEHGFENGDGGDGGFGNAMTPAQATAEWSTLQLDKSFVDALLDPSNPGNKAALAKKTTLFKYMHPE